MLSSQNENVRTRIKIPEATSFPDGKTWPSVFTLIEYLWSGFSFYRKELWYNFDEIGKIHLASRFGAKFTIIFQYLALIFLRAFKTGWVEHFHPRPVSRASEKAYSIFYNNKLNFPNSRILWKLSCKFVLLAHKKKKRKTTLLGGEKYRSVKCLRFFFFLVFKFPLLKSLLFSAKLYPDLKLKGKKKLGRF